MGIEGSLKSSKEIALEKVEAMEDKEKRKPLRSAKEIAMEKAERMLAEAEINKKDAEKMEEIAKTYGLDVSDAIEAKKAEIANIETADGYREIKPEEIGGPAPETDTKEKTKLENVEDADGYQEISAEEMEAKEEEIRAEKAQEQPVAEIQPETGEEMVKSEEIEEKVLSEKNQEASDDKFNREETKGAKNYDKDSGEVVMEHKASEITENEASEKPKNEAVVKEIETAEEKPVAAEERAKIQQEALDDFRRDLKKSPEVKKIDALMAKAWELKDKEKTASKEASLESSVRERPGNVVDITDAGKEKPATAEKREKILMEAVADFRNELKGKKRLTKMFEKILDLAGLGKAQVPEAGRIDRIIRGDRRSDEAIKVDELAGKAFERGKKEKTGTLRDKLESVNNINDLIRELEKTKAITNEEGVEYSTAMQKKHINNLFMTGNPEFLKFITRAEGLRENVKRLFDLMSDRDNEKEEQIKPAA